MNNIKLVIDKCIEFFNISLTFGNYSFTMWQMFLTLELLSIVIYFVYRLFN